MKEVFLLVRPYYGVNIHSDAQGEYGTVLLSNETYPDLPLINAATILKRSPYHDVIVIDAYAEDKMLPDDLLAKISSVRYDKLIIKMTAASVKYDLELVRQIKNIDPRSCIMAAGHVVKDLKKWLSANAPIDHLIDEPVDKFIYRYVYGKEGTLNDFPTPDYSLVNYENYTDDHRHLRLSVLSSRGCIMNCLYCPYIRYYQGYESRSVDRIMEDIKAQLALGAEIIQFRDQFFTFDRAKITELCTRIINENIRFSWICETMLGSLDEELADLMKKAGLFLVCFGIETADTKIQKEYNSQKGSLAAQKKTVEMLRNKGILTMAFYIIGFPEDTWESVDMTYKLAKEINSDIAAFNEYIDFGSDDRGDPDPDSFCDLQNTADTTSSSCMSREEIRYVTGLFRAMYTAEHDCLEKAYTYNYRISEEYKNLISKITGCGYDLKMLSDTIRRINDKQI